MVAGAHFCISPNSGSAQLILTAAGQTTRTVSIVPAFLSCSAASITIRLLPEPGASNKAKAGSLTRALMPSICSEVRDMITLRKS